MAIQGPRILDSEAAALAAARVCLDITRKIREDLKDLESSAELDRPLLGWVLCLAAMVNGGVGIATGVNRRDVVKWKDQYIRWFDEHMDELPLSQPKRKLARQNVIDVFERLIANTVDM